MQFTRLTPAKRTTFTAKWVTKEWLRYTTAFRAIRGRSRNRMDLCWLCRKEFEDDEMIGLACFEGRGRGNKALCGECAEELLSQQSAEIGVEKP